MLRTRFTALLGLLAVVLPGPWAGAKAQASGSDYEQVQNIVAQKADIEQRIADLQNRIDEASAQNTYCTPQQRQEDLRNLRRLQREALALRQEYAQFKQGFINLAATPAAGPRLHEANIHPDERRFWATDDTAVEKLRDSALRKADEVDNAKIVDCQPKETAPVPNRPRLPSPPVTIPTTDEQVARPPTPAPIAPGGPQRLVPPPTMPLGGRLPDTYCNNQERIDELFRLQKELIETDESTREGQARGEQLRGQIRRVKEAKTVSCGPSHSEVRERPQINLPLGEEPNDVTPAQQPKPAPANPGHAGPLQVRIGEARLRLEAEKADCRPTDVEFYKRLRDEAWRRLQASDRASNREQFEAALDDFYDAQAVFWEARERCTLRPQKIVAGEPTNEDHGTVRQENTERGPNVPLGGAITPPRSDQGPNLPFGAPALIMPGTANPYPQPPSNPYLAPPLIFDIPNHSPNEPPPKKQNETQPNEPKPKQGQPEQTGPGGI